MKNKQQNKKSTSKATAIAKTRCAEGAMHLHGKISISHPQLFFNDNLRGGCLFLLFCKDTLPRTNFIEEVISYEKV